MADVESSSWSKTGSGQDKQTINYSGGGTREVVIKGEGGYTVTDTSPTGKQVTGDGVRGILGGFKRMNTK